MAELDKSVLRKRIWSNLVNLKFKLYYIDQLVNQFQKRDRNLNIFIALVSFSSISAWAVWDVLPWLWGLIIAASHVVIAIKPYLPFHKYVKELNAKYLLTEEIQLELELLWYEREHRQIQEKEAVIKFFDLQKKISKALRFSDDVIFSENEKIKDKANRLVKNYLESNYSVSINLTPN